ncbi:NAD(P)/FAD-dependent oxidoreductase [Pararhodospirillum photometricum]|nr:FAD/NAD(P)-binding oxidoreductase [Pararhodospirillum photometricum]
MTDNSSHPPGLKRREVLALGAAGVSMAGLGGLGSLGLSAPAYAADAPVPSKARIVIAGAGAAGLAFAAQLAQRVTGASITLVDARKAHFYQPGYTLVAAGLKPGSYTVSETASYVPSGVSWIEEGVAEFDPEGNSLTTEKGRKIPYDFLVVASGLKLDYAAIDGMDVTRIGQDGLGSHYHSAEGAEATWQAMSNFADKGGVGVFLRPATEMKCAGAPLKYTFITDDVLRKRGTRGKADLVYAAQNKALFSVPIVSEKVRMLFRDRGIATRYDHVMTGIDLGKREAVFQTPDGPSRISYDFINVIPPMRAVDAVRNSPLRWQEGPFAADGWVEVDKASLRHKRFANVWAVGDAAGVPKGKTAASVKWQVPVAVDHLVATLAGGSSKAAYNGYTSCPLITRLGRAMLVEFDYDNNLVPSFPGVIAPLEELWITWVMKTIALKPTYLAMLHGNA